MTGVAYRAIRERRKFVNAPQVKAYMQGALMGEAAPALIKEFDEIVSNWDHKPKFEPSSKVSSNSLELSVEPKGENAKIWMFVSKGTSPHEISPKGKTLAFQWGGKGSYIPKTTPGGGHGGPGASSGPMVFPKKVNHPGIKARNFEDEIREKFKKTFSEIMEKAWRKAIGGL